MKTPSRNTNFRSETEIAKPGDHGPISTDSIDVFTWHRHGVFHEEEDVDYVKKNVAMHRTNGHFFWLEDQIKGKVVLDAGCGGGLKANTIASLGPKLVIGIDGSTTAIAAAKKLSDSLGLKNTEFHVGWMEDIPAILEKLGVDKVDFVNNSFNLHHVTDYKLILSNFSEALAPGGRLYTNWVDPTRGMGSFLFKNRVSYALGSNKESRLKIGKILFSWIDKSKNKNKIEWNSFYADRYAAFYAVIFPWQVKHNLRRAGFEIITAVPEESASAWSLSGPDSSAKKVVRKLIDVIPFLDRPFSLLLRLKQFLQSGDIRAYMCIKTERKNFLKREP